MPRTINDWTIMFFFASNNDLSPLNISQIKALKEAGFQKKTDIVLYFDSKQTGVPTRVFNVNDSRKDKARRNKIGDGRDPYVRNFLEDEILPDDMDRRKGKCTKALFQELSYADTMNATDALKNFIGYCRENNKAKHYILVLVGHGMIVANDSFLSDDSPRSAIPLKQFGQILQEFGGAVRKEGSEFELLGLHSCSMSAIEVAYELKGSARYMMASEGLSYVGSWPYRQLLKKIFTTTEKGLTRATVEVLMQRLYELSLHNATDFAIAGYSHDLTLCNLNEEKISDLVKPLKKLIGSLKEALDHKRGLELIQLAHLKSQSFWQEEYTDIYDFCRCLVQSCSMQDPWQSSLAADCEEVMKALRPRKDPFDGLIVFSDNFGWEYQYAHGLSIYFPWTRPLGEEQTNPLNNYRKYAFNRGLGTNSWFSFLEDYWEKTRRTQRKNARSSKVLDSIMASPHSGGRGALSNKPGGAYNKPSGGYNKPGAGYSDSVCICPSIKNFPITFVGSDSKTDQQDRRDHSVGKRHCKIAVRQLSMTAKVQEAFKWKRIKI